MSRLVPSFRSDYAEQCRRYLVEEIEAFLSGRLAGVVEAADCELPAWVEINWLAHAAPAELREACSRRISGPAGSWTWARDALLHELQASTGGDLGAIAERQRRCLVPVELGLMGRDRRFASPAEVVAEAVSRFREGAPHWGGRQPGSGDG